MSFQPPNQKPPEIFLTRRDLARRWNVCTRTIDRQRSLALIPGCLDLTAGVGKRPIVRFRLSDIEEYERKVLQDPHRREG
jgi:hypothetical protein